MNEVIHEKMYSGLNTVFILMFKGNYIGYCIEKRNFTGIILIICICMVILGYSRQLVL